MNLSNLYGQNVSKCWILSKVCVDPIREGKLLLHPHLKTTTMIIQMIFMEKSSYSSILTLCCVPSAEASDIPPCVWMLSRFDTTWKGPELEQEEHNWYIKRIKEKNLTLPSWKSGWPPWTWARSRDAQTPCRKVFSDRLYAPEAFLGRTLGRQNYWKT